MINFVFQNFKLTMKKIIALIFCLFAMTLHAKDIHPYHVGSVEFNYSEKTKTFQITARFFMDDLENALNKKYGNSIHFQNEKFKQKINENLQKYCSENLRLKIDNQFIKINYLGYDEDREAVEIFLESEKVKSPKKVEAAVSFLYNLFDDQLNIIHIIVNGQRKSQKLSFPDRYLYQQF